MARITDVESASREIRKRCVGAEVDCNDFEDESYLDAYHGAACYEIVGRSSPFEGTPASWSGVGWTETSEYVTQPGQPFPLAGPPEDAPRDKFSNLESAVEAAIAHLKKGGV